MNFVIAYVNKKITQYKYKEYYIRFCAVNPLQKLWLLAMINHLRTGFIFKWLINEFISGFATVLFFEITELCAPFASTLSDIPILRY